MAVAGHHAPWGSSTTSQIRRNDPCDSRAIWRYDRCPCGGKRMDKPVTPRGINHLVLNVRDIEESHKFWTEIVGMTQVGELHPREGRPTPKMRFYSGDHDGQFTHHDIALVESPNVPPPSEWVLANGH